MVLYPLLARKGRTCSKENSAPFEAWSLCVAGIIEVAGFSSPCLSASLTTGGDTDTQDMERLVKEMPHKADSITVAIFSTWEISLFMLPAGK